MTRKPRRPGKNIKSEGKDSAASRPNSGDGEGTPGGIAPGEDQDNKTRPADQRTEGGSSQPTKGKPGRLPAFGFAADLLAAARGGAEETEPASSDGAEEQAAAGEAIVERGVGPVAEPTAPDRIFRFADSLERVEEEAEVARRITTWITFSLANEIFALPVTPVREVLRISHITRVPHAPRPIRGVTNLRGRVIPIIDLRVRIELPATTVDRSTRAIVVGSRGRLIGLMVDAVHQVVHIDLNRVQPPPDDVMTVQSDYLSGVYQQDNQLILLLDVDRALIIQESEEAQTAGAA